MNHAEISSKNLYLEIHVSTEAALTYGTFNHQLCLSVYILNRELWVEDGPSGDCNKVVAIISCTWGWLFYVTLSLLLLREGKQKKILTLCRIISDVQVDQLRAASHCFLLKGYLGHVLLGLFCLFQFRNRWYLCFLGSYSYSRMNGTLFCSFCSW